MESRGERGVRGRNIQISNCTAGNGFSVKTNNRKGNQVLDRVSSGDGVAINDALNQIHRKSLKDRGKVDWKGLSVVSMQGERNYTTKTYSQVVKDLHSEGKKRRSGRLPVIRKGILKLQILKKVLSSFPTYHRTWRHVIYGIYLKWEVTLKT